MRAQLKELLEPLIPDDWRIIPEQRVPEVIERVTVILKLLELVRLPEAPMSHLANSFTVTIASPYVVEQGKAEDQLDDAVRELITALDQMLTVSWSLARKVLVNEKNLGWDITLTMTTKKEN